MDMLIILIVMMVSQYQNICQNFVILNLSKSVKKLNKQNWCTYTREIYVAVLKNEVGLINTEDFQDIVLDKNIKY